MIELLKDSLGLDNLTREDLNSDSPKGILLFDKLKNSCHWNVVFEPPNDIFFRDVIVFREVNHGKFVFLQSHQIGSNKHPRTITCFQEKPTGGLLVKLFQASNDWEKSDEFNVEVTYRDSDNCYNFKNKEGKVVSIQRSFGNRNHHYQYWSYYGDEEDIPDYNCFLNLAR